MLYLWLKVFHFFSFVAWFASMFYIWRLFVYHSNTEVEAVKQQFKIMEERLYKYIMNPAMIFTLITGLGLLHVKHHLIQTSWFWVKLMLLVLLIGHHHMAGAYIKKFKMDTCSKSAKFFRIMNEVPTVILISILILAIIKPFN